MDGNLKTGRNKVLKQTGLFFWWKKTVAVADPYKIMSLSSHLENVQGTLNTKKENESERTTQTVKEVEGVCQ